MIPVEILSMALMGVSAGLVVSLVALRFSYQDNEELNELYDTEKKKANQFSAMARRQEELRVKAEQELEITRTAINDFCETHGGKAPF